MAERLNGNWELISKKQNGGPMSADLPFTFAWRCHVPAAHYTRFTVDPVVSKFGFEL